MVACLYATLLTAATFASADNVNAIFEQRTEEAYQAARKIYALDHRNVEAAWKLARACFDRAEFARHDDQRADLAEEGIHASRQALTIDPKSGPAHYYLGLNLGELARTKGLNALPLLREMEEQWLLAVKFDENFDYAGADRGLGTLYRDAPNWPVSLGSRAKARQFLLRAITVKPNYPENHIALAEAYVKFNEHQEAAAEAEVIEAMFPAAHREFAGPQWESTWADWNKRWDAIQGHLHLPRRPQTPHAR